jgi:hypothetical protein
MGEDEVLLLSNKILAVIHVTFQIEAEGPGSTAE